MIKDIFIWLVIFIIGSLVVSSIIDPEVYYNLKGDVIYYTSSLISLFPSQSSIDDGVRLIPSEMDEYSIYMQYIKKCSDVEKYGRIDRISSPKQKVCIRSCGFRDMEYLSTRCEDDLFVCYCKTDPYKLK